MCSHQMRHSLLREIVRGVKQNSTLFKLRIQQRRRCRFFWSLQENLESHESILSDIEGVIKRNAPQKLFPAGVSLNAGQSPNTRLA
jgi:hypothetical protein